MYMYIYIIYILYISDIYIYIGLTRSSPAVVLLHKFLVSHPHTTQAEHRAERSSAGAPGRKPEEASRDESQAAAGIERLVSLKGP